MTNKIETIRQALRSLGFKSGKVSMKIFYGDAIVYLNGSYFGRYCFARNTFVD